MSDGTTQPISFLVSMLLGDPYGHSAPLHTYKTLIFITGGTGIAGATSYFKDYIVRLASTRPTTKTRGFPLIWPTKQEAKIYNITAKELAPVLIRSGTKTSLLVISASATSTIQTSSLKEASSRDGENSRSSVASTGSYFVHT